MTRPGNASLIHRLLLLAYITICGVFTSAAFAQDAPRIQAELGSPVVVMGESVNLQIVTRGIDAELDVSALEAEFDVISRASSRQVNIINGNRQSTVIWNIGIQPRRSGELVVPSVSVGQLSTRPLRLQVTDAPVGSDRQVYLEASVDNLQPYVQSQVIYTIKIYQRVQFSADSLGYPEVEGVTVQQFESDKQFTEEVNGQPYAVFQRRYVLFPQNSGRIVLPSVILQGSMPGTRNTNTGIFTPRNRFTRQSNSIVLDVQPRPATFAGQWWLPATSLKLSADWITPAEEFIVGRPLTRVVTLTANGVTESQLPDIAPPEMRQARVYGDESEANTVSNDNGVQAQRRFSWAIIPQAAGKLTLPQITVPWFDVATGTMQSAIVPAETIEIQAAAVDSQAPASTVTQVDTNADVDRGSSSISASNELAAGDLVMQASLTFWKRLAFVLGVGWLATIAIWLYGKFRNRFPRGVDNSSRKASSRPRMSIHIAAVEAAIKESDFIALSRSVMAWGNAGYTRSFASPGEIAKQVKSAELSRLLSALDAALYSPNQAADVGAFEELAQLLRAELPATVSANGAISQKSHALPAL